MRRLAAIAPHGRNNDGARELYRNSHTHEQLRLSEFAQSRDLNGRRYSETTTTGSYRALCATGRIWPHPAAPR